MVLGWKLVPCRTCRFWSIGPYDAYSGRCLRHGIFCLGDHDACDSWEGQGRANSPQPAHRPMQHNGEKVT